MSNWRQKLSAWWQAARTALSAWFGGRAAWFAAGGRVAAGPAGHARFPAPLVDPNAGVVRTGMAGGSSAVFSDKQAAFQQLTGPGPQFNDGLPGALDDLRDRFSETEARLERFEEGLDQLLRRHGDAERRQIEYNNNLNTAQRDVARLAEEAQSSGTRSEELLRRAEAAGARLGELDRRLAGIEEQLAARNERSERIAAVVERIAAGVDQLPDAAALRGELHPLLDGVDAQRQELDALLAAVQSTVEHARQAREIVAVLPDIATDQSRMLGAMQQQAQVIDERTAALADEQRQSAAAVESLRQPLEQMSRALVRSEQSDARLHEIIGQALARQRELLDKHAESMKGLRVLYNHIVEQEKRAGGLETQVRRLVATMENRQSELTERLAAAIQPLAGRMALTRVLAMVAAAAAVIAAALAGMGYFK